MILELWQNTVARRGDQPAIIEAAGGRAVTFAQLDAAAEAWRRRHVPGGEVRRQVILLAERNGPGWFTAFLGLLRAGAVIVPVDPAEPVAAQERMGRQLGAAGRWNGASWQGLGGGRRFATPDPCLVKLTSGSTGTPRALVFKAAEMVADARQVMGTMGIDARDVNYGAIPFGHSYGLGNLVFPLLISGVPVVCASAVLPAAIASDLERWRPTVFPGVPALWRVLGATDTARALSGLRLAISAGARLPVETAEALFARTGVHLHNFYGSSETGGIAFDRDGRATLAGGVGTALDGVHLHFTGDRLEVRSPAVFTYGNRRRCEGVGAWRVHDRVERTPDGGIVVAGRAGAPVKIGGRRIDPEAVAQRIRALQGVSEAWVGVREAAEPELTAIVAAGRPVAEIRAELLRVVAPWQVPKRWLTVPELPLTARGKTDLAALRRLLEPTIPG